MNESHPPPKPYRDVRRRLSLEPNNRESCDGASITDALVRKLAALDLGLVSVLPLDALDDGLSADILEAARRVGLVGDSDPAHVIIVGNRGGDFFERVDTQASDPLDDYSASGVTAVLEAVGIAGVSVLVYPGDCRFSLQRLGQACGWGHPSWLGVSIHPEVGTWFAFRAVAVSRAPLAPRVFEPCADACLDCTGRDCRAACPVDAPGPPGSFLLGACIERRMAPGSGCARGCIARARCPVGAGFRYSDPLIEYLYARSLHGLRR